MIIGMLGIGVGRWVVNGLMRKSVLVRGTKIEDAAQKTLSSKQEKRDRVRL